MAFMGYETPVAIPSMGVYDTDLMKMYIAGVKDLYEKGQEEMKDFMKLYGDFYSPVPGATEAYNNMTIGGARDMINQMLANGIDPYKSPEARAAISRYIASVPTGAIKLLELQKEDYSKYQDAVRDAMASGTYNEPMEKYYLQKEGLDNFLATSRNPDGTIKVNDWTRLAPAKFSTLESITNPFFKDLEKIDFVGNDPKHPGYSLYKVADDVLANALRGGVDAVRNNPNGDFYVYLAEKKLNNAGITRETNPENYDLLVAELLAEDVKQANAQAWQTKSDWDKYGQEMRGYAQDIKMEGIRHNNRMIESGHKWDPKTKKWIAPGGGDEDPQQPEGLSITNRLMENGFAMTAKKTGTTNSVAGQNRLLKNHINLNKGHAADAKMFLLQNFSQDLNGQTFAALATGVKSADGHFNYRPYRDGKRLNTYTQLGNNLATGGVTVKYSNRKKRNGVFGEIADDFAKIRGNQFRFLNNTVKTNKYTPKNSSSSEEFTYRSDDINSIIKHLNSLYDPKTPERILIFPKGNAFSTLQNDGNYHLNASTSVVVYNKDCTEVEEEFDLPYDFAVPMNPYTGEHDLRRSAEGVLSDQIATITAGGRPNSNNKTVVLTGVSNTKKK